MTTLAFAGAGHISAVHGLAAQAAGVAVTQVASRRWDRALERADQMGAQPCTYAELPGGADVVFVVTPPSCHANDTIQALQGGAAAIVEKPLATTLDDADRLVTAAARTGGRVGYAENLAFAPVIRQARARMADLGAVHHLRLRTLQSRPDWGQFLTEAWGGGALFDLGAHPIAVALLLAAPARPTQVAAHLSGAAEIAVDDHAEVSLSFSSGLQAQLTVSWRHADPVWDLEAASATGVVRAELSPTLSLEVNGEPEPLPVPRADLASPRLEQMGYLSQLQSFVAEFLAGREPEMSAAFGRTVLDITCAAYASAGNGGRPEPLPFTGRRDRTPLQLWRGT